MLMNDGRMRVEKIDFGITLTLDNIESLDQIYLRRRLAWYEKYSMMKQDDQGTILPRKFLKTWCAEESEMESIDE